MTTKYNFGCYFHFGQAICRKVEKQFLALIVDTEHKCIRN